MPLHAFGKGTIQVPGAQRRETTYFHVAGPQECRQQACALKPQGLFWWVPTSCSYRTAVAAVKGRGRRKIILIWRRHSTKRSEVIGYDEFSTPMHDTFL